MIAIATGRKDLDEAIKVELADGYIVNYKEFLITNDENYQFETVILSRHLKGTTMEMEELLFCLKQEDIRIIYLTNEDEYEEIRMCLKLNIYDIILDPIATEKVKYVFNNPMQFSDISNLYVKLINDETIEEEKTTLKNLFKKKNEATEISQVKTEIKVIEKVINTSIGPTTIAVGGTKAGAGTTNMSIEIAKYLRTINKRIALVELNNKPVLKSINIAGIDIYSQDCIDYAMDNPVNLLNNVNIDEYNYIVIDLGSLYYFKSGNSCEYNECTAEKSEHFHEMNRSHISVLVHPAGEWNLKYFTPFLINNDISSKWKLALTHTETIDKRIREEFKNYYAAPYMLNIAHEDTISFMQDMLKEIATVRKPKRNLLEKLDISKNINNIKNMIKRESEE